MTTVYCTDMDCRFSKILTCQKNKIRLILVEGRKGDSWICGDCKLPPDSERQGPVSIRKKVKAPVKRKINKAIKKKKGK
jgi:hypothetical protein